MRGIEGLVCPTVGVVSPAVVPTLGPVMPVTHVNPALPDVVLSYAPPAPMPGGGRSGRRRRGPAWGIAPIATDPDAWAAGRPRRRLVRAATLTSVMGVAWAGASAPPVPAPAPDQLAATLDAVTAEDHREFLQASPVRVEGGGGAGPGTTHVHAARTGTTDAAPPPAAGDAPQRGPRAGDAWRRNVIATHGDIEIVQPSPHVRLVAFHEGGTRADDVRPGATPDRDLGERPVTSARRDDPLTTMILPTRGRGTGSATAIDVAMPEGRKVFAPITGTVTAANQYSLYGQHPDTIITIQPDGAPDVEMEILHVVDPQVEVGDRVEAGRTVLAASPNLLPFPSQIDRFVAGEGPALPHVHLEMQRVG